MVPRPTIVPPGKSFRRQVYITSHGPAHMTVSGMVRDFFDETKVPILYMDVLKAGEAANFKLMDAFHEMSIGAYKVLGRLEDVPLNVPESQSVTYDVGHMLAGMGKNPGNLLGKYAYQSGAVGSYFDAPSDHMATPLLKTPEEREAYAEAGVQAINEFVKALDMPRSLKHFVKWMFIRRIVFFLNTGHICQAEKFNKQITSRVRKNST
ncbi:hypothetical protein V7075_11505 [Neobacillus drentensis]|uniref:hypothetical protein n=1 Tax=Neobacillus drentensis TaxID=220684 RepID=UPI002FFD8729